MLTIISKQKILHTQYAGGDSGTDNINLRMLQKISSIPEGGGILALHILPSRKTEQALCSLLSYAFLMVCFPNNCYLPLSLVLRP